MLIRMPVCFRQDCVNAAKRADWDSNGIFSPARGGAGLRLPAAAAARRAQLLAEFDKPSGLGHSRLLEE